MATYRLTINTGTNTKATLRRQTSTGNSTAASPPVFPTHAPLAGTSGVLRAQCSSCRVALRWFPCLAVSLQHRNRTYILNNVGKEGNLHLSLHRVTFPLFSPRKEKFSSTKNRRRSV